jgi:hypothetical protein
MSDTHPSVFAIGRFAQEASPPHERATLEQHLPGCETCRETLAEANRARDRFSQSVLPRTLPHLQLRASRRLPVWSFPLVLAAAAAAAFVLVRRDTEPGFTFKGAPTLRVFVHRGDRVLEVAQRDALRTGDQLRFEIDPEGFPFLLVGAIDDSGTATIYVPFEGKESERVTALATYPSSGSLVLDDAPGPERVFALLSQSPLEAEPLLSALRDLGRKGPDAIRTAQRLPLAAGAQVSFLWEKETP